MKRRSLLGLGGLAGLVAPHVCRWPAIIRPAQAAQYQRGVVSVDQFAAIGNGSADDSSPINAALTAVGTTINGVYGGRVMVPKGQYLCTASGISLPNGVHLVGEGPGTACTIRAANSFSGAALVTNANHNGTQEFAFLEKLTIDGNKGGGATITHLVEYVGIFVNSFIRDCIIQNGSGVGLFIGNDTSGGNAGPIEISNNWVHLNSGDNILVEQSNASGGMTGLVFRGNATENCGTGNVNFHFINNGTAGGIFGISIQQHHFEQGTASSNYHLKFEGTNPIGGVFAQNLELETGDPSGFTAGVSLTNVFESIFFCITNPNAISTVLVDTTNSATISSPSVPVMYITPDTNTWVGAGANPGVGYGAASPTSSFQTVKGMVVHG